MSYHRILKKIHITKIFFYCQLLSIADDGAKDVGIIAQIILNCTAPKTK